MVEMTVGELLAATGACLVSGGADVRCRGCVIDSREVREGSIFVAIEGNRVDGNDFAPAAVKAGAACIVLSREPTAELVWLAADAGCAVCTVDDPTSFLLSLAAWYRSTLPATVVGITGSIGKTTTKDVLTALLRTRFSVHATKGNHNNLIGLPLTVLSAPADTEVLVLEMGMNHPGEIGRLARCARPDIGIITKVGTSHVGLLGGRENIARAKAEMTCGMSPGSVLVLGGEDEFTPFIAENFAEPKGIEVLRCGTGEGDAVRARDIRVDADGHPSFVLELPDEEPLLCTLSLMGAQSVQNALYAAAVAHRLGVTGEEICGAFGALSVTGRRQEVRRARNGARVIDDSYNASPESMAAALDLLAELPCEGSRIAVLGEMGELGDEAPRLHALVGAYAAAKKPALLICVGGDAADQIASAARLMGLDPARIRTVPSTEVLIERYRDLLGADDLALVKGSRFVGLDRYVEEVCTDAR